MIEELCFLAECPCGETPKTLVIQSIDNMDKRANVGGDCCGEWEIEYRNNGAIGDECYKIAVKAWNNAPRG